VNENYSLPKYSSSPSHEYTTWASSIIRAVNQQQQILIWTRSNTKQFGRKYITTKLVSIITCKAKQLTKF
jgi:hypothetical protein